MGCPSRIQPLLACAWQIRHGTSAPAFKGNVRRCSDWFIARYAQTTPMTNVATTDQPILDLHWAQESFIPPA